MKLFQERKMERLVPLRLSKAYWDNKFTKKIKRRCDLDLEEMCDFFMRLHSSDNCSRKENCLRRGRSMTRPKKPMTTIKPSSSRYPIRTRQRPVDPGRVRS